MLILLCELDPTGVSADRTPCTASLPKRDILVYSYCGQASDITRLCLIAAAGTAHRGTADSVLTLLSAADASGGDCEFQAAYHLVTYGMHVAEKPLQRRVWDDSHMQQR